MAGRGKEICVVLLDVGPRMKPCLEHASKAVSNLFLSKIINKPSHEAALLLYGTSGSDNDLYEEFSAQGDDSQYCNITQIHALGPPTMEYLTAMHELKAEEGSSDFVDALICAADAVYRALSDRPQLEGKMVKKRIVLVSNFLMAAKEDEGWEFAKTLTAKLQQHEVMLEVMSIDIPQQDRENQADKQQNIAALRQILPHVRHRKVSVQSPGEVLSAFPFKEYSSTAYYSGPLSFANFLSIYVKVTKKTNREMLPSLGKYSTLSIAEDATHSVTYDRSFKLGEGDDEEIVAPEDVGKAYKYGSQIVPLPREAELAMKYSPEKSFQVIGIVSQDAVPHSLFVKDTWMVAPDKGIKESFQALSAIAKALRKDNTGLLARFLPRVNGDISIGLMTPLPTAKGGDRACLVMNILPFEADLRTASFTAFSQKADLLPHKDQTAAVEDLIKAFSLVQGSHEETAPETTANPALLRFLDVIRDMALDPDSQIPEENACVDALFSTTSTKSRNEAIKQIAKQFEINTKGANASSSLTAAEELIKAEGKDVEGSSQGVENGTLQDFENLVDSGLMQDAFTGLIEAAQKAIATRQVKVAQRLAMRLRGASIEFKKPEAYNGFLQKATADEACRAVLAFWEWLKAELLGLITEDDCIGGASIEQADSFLQSLPKARE